MEAIVLFICTAGGGNGCTEASQSYYTYNVNLQDWAKREQKQFEDKIGKENMSLIGTGIGLTFVRKGSIPMGNNIHLTIGDETTLSWKKDF